MNVVFFLFLIIAQVILNPGSAERQPGSRCNVSEDEFRCSANNQCLPKIKVCNFVADCPDGEDEQRCGACRGSHLHDCGLTLLNDRILRWSIGGPDLFFERPPEGPANDEPARYLTLKVDLSQEQLLNKDHLGSIVFTPRIMFPSLRPTDNAQCSLSFLVHTERAFASPREQDRQASPGAAAAAAANATFENESEFNLLNSWPKLQVSAIVPSQSQANKRLHKSLARISLAHSSGWTRHTLVVGSMATYWSPMLEVQSQLFSDTPMLANFEYLNCEPVDLAKLEGQKQVADLSLHADGCDQKRGKFFCPISGLCIEERLVCDFGYDCGPLDHSDEAQCDHFEGRCDFEEPDQCSWVSPKEGWLRVGARDLNVMEAGANRTRMVPKPKQDHTYEAFGRTIIAGHYMLVNSNQLRVNEFVRLFGPQVLLQPNAHQCYVRFWLETPASLDVHQQQSVHLSAQLSVGYESLGAGELFDRRGHSVEPAPEAARMEQANKPVWRRFEVLLIGDKSAPPIESVKLAFGKMGERDLEIFSLASGYLALDDLSFSSGCQVNYHELAPDMMCPTSQFFCRHPTEVTRSYCIPMEMVCDFKSDCGMEDGAPIAPIANDELECPKECSFAAAAAAGGDTSNSCVKQFGTQSSSALRPMHEHDPFIEEHLGDHFLIHTDGKKYGKFDTSMRENAAVWLSTFSMSHANCTFELVYQWSCETENMRLSIVVQHLGDQLRVYEEAASGEDCGKKSRLQLNVGQNMVEFFLALEVSLFATNATSKQESGTPSGGQLSIFSYNFQQCSYEKGLIDASHQSHVIRVADLVDGLDYDELEGDPLAATSDIAYLAPNQTCPPGQFQCEAPILCVEERLLCDMQRDCQLSGLDELNCASLGVVQFDFEPRTPPDDGPSLEPTNTGGWLNDRQRSSVDFTRQQVAAKVASVRAPNWPPMDHTLSVGGKYRKSQRWSASSGSFLGLTSEEQGEQVGIIYSPRFELSAECNRLVLYVYEWAEAASRREPNHYRLEILIEFSQMVSVDESTGGRMVRSLGEFGPDISAGRFGGGDNGTTIERRVGWRRLEFDLRLDQEAKSELSPSTLSAPGRWFTVALVGTVGGEREHSLMIAIDDVSFGLQCRLAANQEEREFAGLFFEAKLDSSALRGSESNLLLVAVVFVCSSMAVGSLLFALFIYIKRPSGLFAKKRAPDEHSLQNERPSSSHPTAIFSMNPLNYTQLQGAGQ